MIKLLIIICAVLFCALCMISIGRSHITLSDDCFISVSGKNFIVHVGKNDFCFKTDKTSLLNLFQKLESSYFVEEKFDAVEELSNEEGSLKFSVGKKKINVELIKNGKKGKGSINVNNLSEIVLKLSNS